MTIEEHDCIDILGTSKDGPDWVIVDPGNLSEHERLAALNEKLKAYRRALLSEVFQVEHPKWRNASIKVGCAVEPTEAMKRVIQVELAPERCEFLAVPVTYEFILSPFG
jgi:hypothetical protein